MADVSQGKEYANAVKDSAGARLTEFRNPVQGSASSYAVPVAQPASRPPAKCDTRCDENKSQTTGCIPCPISGGRTRRRRHHSRKTHSKGGRSRKCRRKNKKSQSRPHSKQ